MKPDRCPVVHLIPGTHAWDPKQLTGQWYHKGSAFRELLCAQDFDFDVFAWSTGLDGLLPWRKLYLWHSTGIFLHHHIIPPRAPWARCPPLETHMITHSHGLQPALVAASLGLYIHTLIDISGPVRDDMIKAYGPAARKNIGHWIHVYSPGDWTGWAGGIGDGVFDWLNTSRPHPLADVNYRLPGAGHSGVLNDVSWMGVWDTWFDLIRKRDGHADEP